MKVLSFCDYKNKKVNANEYRDELVSQVIDHYNKTGDEELGGDDFYISYLKENIPTYMLEEILERLKKEAQLAIYMYAKWITAW